jgi:threonine aldolase
MSIREVIDFRSDTVTMPSEAMREHMRHSELGDDVYGEDPTVNLLQTTTAELSGHEAGLFLPTGTQSNLVALLSHCQRGDEYIVGQTAHTYKYEGGGAAVLGSIQPQPIEFEADGTLDLKKVRAKIKDNDIHFARSRLLSLENTVGGKVVCEQYLNSAKQFTLDHKLAFHLDGARVMNAAVAQQLPLKDITARFDSVSICLSKGLGAPVGSVLCGSESFIHEAKRWRKMLGGGMRQAGVIASAGLYALQNDIQQLADDHKNAQRLAQGLMELEQVQVVDNQAQTNMVFITVQEQQPRLIAFMQEHGIKLSAGEPMRLVTHMGISADDIEYTLARFEAFFHK